MKHKGKITITLTFKPTDSHILPFLAHDIPSQARLLQDLVDLLEKEEKPMGILKQWNLKFGHISSPTINQGGTK